MASVMKIVIENLLAALNLWRPADTDLADGALVTTSAGEHFEF